jgi:hypothetical protein
MPDHKTSPTGNGLATVIYLITLLVILVFFSQLILFVGG